MQKRKMFLILAIALIVALALPLGVSAQGNEIVSYTYAGQTYTLVSGHPVFQPGDTTTTGKLLSSAYPFSVQSYANRTAMESGNVLGRADAEYAATLLGDEYTLSVQGTTAAMWLEVIVGSTESDGFWYDGVLTSLHNGHLVVQAGDTQVTPQMIYSNAVFVVVNYLNAAAVEASTPTGSLPANCTTLVGQQCTVEVRGTDASMMLEILPASTGSSSVTATTTVVSAVVATATPNPLLGEVGSSEATAASSYNWAATQPNQWYIETFPSTNPFIEGWRRELIAHPVDHTLWPTAPNMPNPLVPAFRVVEGPNGPEVPDGMEWGQDLIRYCQQDTRCDATFATGHTTLYTGDFDTPAFSESCFATPGEGCILIVANTGNVTTTFEDQHFYRGYLMEGEFFNGAEPFWISLWGLASHASGNMINADTSLNTSDSTNAGANCSVREGCNTVRITIVGISGTYVEWKAHFLYVP